MHPNSTRTGAPELRTHQTLPCASPHLAVYLYPLPYPSLHDKSGNISVSLSSVSHDSKFSNLRRGRGNPRRVAQSDINLGNLGT